MTQQKTKGVLIPYRVLDLAEDGCMLWGKVLGEIGGPVQIPTNDASVRYYIDNFTSPQKSNMLWTLT